VVGGLAMFLSRGSSNKSALVYLVSQGSNPGIISAYKLDLKKGTLSSDNGALTVNGKSANTGTQPTALLFDPSQTFAFVADFGSPSDPGTDNSKKNGDIAVFSIAKDGALASVGITSFPVDDCLSSNPVSLATDAQGKFLFVAVRTFYNVNGSASCPANPRTERLARVCGGISDFVGDAGDDGVGSDPGACWTAGYEHTAADRSRSRQYSELHLRDRRREQYRGWFRV
jgi:hypothetical protein